MAESADVVLDGNGQGVRIDGAPNAGVADNVISSARDDVSGDIGAVVVTGGQQVVEGADGLTFFNYNGGAADSPPTASNVSITGNVIGNSAVTGGDDESAPRPGSSHGRAEQRRRQRQRDRGPRARGRAARRERALGARQPHRHRPADVPHPVATVGVLTDGAPSSAVGADGRGDTIHTTSFGVVHVGGSTNGSIVANEITAATTARTASGSTTPTTSACTGTP